MTFSALIPFFLSIPRIYHNASELCVNILEWSCVEELKTKKYYEYSIGLAASVEIKQPMLQDKESSSKLSKGETNLA